MLRNVSLEDISDGKLYTDNDMVKVDTAQCAGCKTVCCQNMGRTIVLDPCDVYVMTNGLSRTFADMLDSEVELGVVDGLVLPNLKMQDDGKCAFLMDDNRCRIHTSRPGICRMFPLGRYWEDGTHFKYIVQKGECNKDGLAKIKLKKWLGISNLESYNTFVVKWHQYIKQLQAALPELDESQTGILSTFNLRLFYMTAYDGCADISAFYKEFENRLRLAREKLEIGDEYV